MPFVLEPLYVSAEVWSFMESVDNFKQEEIVAKTHVEVADDVAGTSEILDVKHEFNTTSQYGIMRSKLEFKNAHSYYGDASKYINMFCNKNDKNDKFLKIIQEQGLIELEGC